MGKTPLYPQGWEQMNVIVPRGMKKDYERVAQRQHRSVSQYVTIVLRRHLQEHGELPEREEVKSA